jgi:hypothetical protein
LSPERTQCGPGLEQFHVTILTDCVVLVSSIVDQHYDFRQLF